MPRSGARLGGKVRALRRKENLTQAQMARELGISASYLNLIEHDRRPLSAAIFLKLTQLFKVDVEGFATDEDSQLRTDLIEALADPMFDGLGLTNADVRELLTTSPGIANALRTLYRAHRNTQERLHATAAKISDAEETGTLRPATEEASDFLQRHRNHFPELEQAAEALWSAGTLDRNDTSSGLMRHLRQVHGIQVKVVEVDAMEGAVKRYLPGRRMVTLSEALEPQSRSFLLAQQIGLLDHSATIDAITKEESFTSPDSRKLARVALANYFASATLMPYQTFLDAAKAMRYDLDLLGHRFRTSVEQVCHRLTNLGRPGAEGVPFHFMRVDVAGNISKRFSASGMRFARFSGACPRWNVFAAFLTPGMWRVQLSNMSDGSTFFSFGRTLTKGTTSFKSTHTMHAIEMGCDVRYAKELVYADGIDLDNQATAVPIGVTCRLCDRMDCEQRSMPPIQHPLRVDENVRGVSFFAPDRKSTRQGS